MTSRGELENFLSSQHRRFLREIQRARTANKRYTLTADDVLEMKLLADKYDENPLTTGIPFWDELVGPLRRGDVYLLCGYAGTGKSTLAAQIAWAIAQQRRKVWFYCLELRPHQSFEMVAGHIVGNAEPTHEEIIIANTKLVHSGLRFYDSRDHETWQRHLEIIPEEVEREAYELVIIDNFHYLTRVDKNVYEVEGVVSQRLKALAMSMNIPVLVLHHLRKVDGDHGEPDPTMHSIRGAGALVNDASGVMILHHPLTGDDEDSDRHPVGKLKLVKNRWGRAGKVYVRQIGHRRLYEQASVLDYKGKTSHSRQRRMS